MDDFKKADGMIDWPALRQAEIANGERCRICETFLLFGKGHPDKCMECRMLVESVGEVTHASRIRCPKCAYAYEPCELYETAERTCPECETDFEVRVHVTFSYTSPARLPETEGAK